VITALRARGLNVITAFASGLDGRPAVEKFFMRDGKSTVDAVVSHTGFSHCGCPAYKDAKAAEEALAALDVPYISAFASEFQTLQSWALSEQGMTPVEATIMVAIPEIDGATGPIVFGGRSDGSGPASYGDTPGAAPDNIDPRDMQPCVERCEMLAARVAKLVRLRRKPKSERRVATVLYNFPPNGGATGTAAYLSVFQSLFNTLKSMKAEGYSVDVPESVDALREVILGGNSQTHGQPANVAYKVPVDDHVRRESALVEIEAVWGAAPGRVQANGREIFVLGAHFGNVFVGVQPPFGYEGDPMRLLFEKGFAPTHAFSAFYTYLRQDLDADAVLHFGTHGALEFMPGKQSGLSANCWPDRLIGDLPNIYLYAANNPSEGALAKRRSAATIVSHLTPPVAKAGLYKGLADLKSSIGRYRSVSPEKAEERIDIARVIRDQAEQLDLIEEGAPAWFGDATDEVTKLASEVHEFEMSLIPHGLHVVGDVMDDQQRADLLHSCNSAAGDVALADTDVDKIANGHAIDRGALHADHIARLERLNTVLKVDHETPALLHALDGGYIRPVSGGDIIRSPEIVPTGRNLHGFDPFRLPSAFACVEGEAQAELLVQRYRDDHDGALPQRIAMVLWGTDNLKSEGAPIAQTLALVGAKPRFDGFGRLAGADLISLEELGRPRIDVVVTLSGIFRDLLPLQTKMLAQAFLKAASAEEPEHLNPVRAHALQYMADHNCDLATAALRVFSNASGAYGSNINLLIDSGVWDHEDELADAYSNRKGFAYGVDGNPLQRTDVLNSVLSSTQMAYQNIESVELGITTIDHYFDTLGGISRAISRSGGGKADIYVGDQTTGKAKVRTLSEQVSLESRTRTLNPKFYEALLDHGYEGVRQIEAQVTNTLGWSATTGEVAPWIYRDISETFVLDREMRDRMAMLNPKASAKLANRLIEASDRNFWKPDEETLNALLDASDELEDRLEGLVADGTDRSVTLEAAE
ncbi:MAG: magnesium chelatase subunit H, partial [Pseudomonadota bacterium]